MRGRRPATCGAPLRKPRKRGGTLRSAFTILPALIGGSLLGCDAAPTEPLDGQLWALHAIDGQALPARPTVFVNDVIADTLEFGVESPRWKPRPLARAIRWFAAREGPPTSDEWWYTYDPTPGSTFAIRGLCADGDLASCIDASATATIEESTLTIRFRDPGLGLLTYRRIR